MSVLTVATAFFTVASASPTLLHHSPPLPLLASAAARALLAARAMLAARALLAARPTRRVEFTRCGKDGGVIGKMMD